MTEKDLVIGGIFLLSLIIISIVSRWRYHKKHAWIELNRSGVKECWTNDKWEATSSSNEHELIDLDHIDDGPFFSCEYTDNDHKTLSLKWWCGIGPSLMGTFSTESINDLSNSELRLLESTLSALCMAHAYFKIQSFTDIHIGLDGHRRELCEQAQSIVEEFIIRFICPDYYGNVFINTNRIAIKI